MQGYFQTPADVTASNQFTDIFFVKYINDIINYQPFADFQNENYRSTIKPLAFLTTPQIR